MTSSWVELHQRRDDLHAQGEERQHHADDEELSRDEQRDGQRDGQPVEDRRDAVRREPAGLARRAHRITYVAQPEQVAARTVITGPNVGPGDIVDKRCFLFDR